MLNNNIFHCYNKNRKEVDVFLEDYAYYCLLLVSIYEINKDENSLKKCSELLKQTWNSFPAVSLSLSCVMLLSMLWTGCHEFACVTDSQSGYSIEAL